jgi:hypothetical protein
MTTSEDTRERPLLGLRRRPGRLALRAVRSSSAGLGDRLVVRDHPFVAFQPVTRREAAEAAPAHLRA